MKLMVTIDLSEMQRVQDQFDEALKIAQPLAAEASRHVETARPYFARLQVDVEAQSQPSTLASAAEWLR